MNGAGLLHCRCAICPQLANPYLFECYLGKHAYSVLLIPMTKIISSNASNPNAMLHELASALKDKGQIERAISGSDDGLAKSSFNSVGKFDKLISRFIPGFLKIRRESALNEIRKLVEVSKVPNGEQLLANIRAVMEQKGKLKGKDVAREINHFLSKDPAKIIQGGPVVPTATSAISYMQVSPLRVVADQKIIRSSTLAAALEAKSEHHQVAQAVDGQMNEILKKRNAAQDPRGAGEHFNVSDPFSPTGKISVMADIWLEGAGYQSQFITDNDLKEMYRQMFTGLSGTVVVEPFADEATRRDTASPTLYQHGEKHLRVLQEAMKEAVEAAKKENKELKFVIATEDATAYSMVKDVALQAASPKKPGMFQT